MQSRIPNTYTDKHGTYYVRYVFPINIQANLPELGRDIRRSLKTKSPREARTRSRRFLSTWESIIACLIMTNFRDKAYYIGLITGVDPFGNPYKIKHDTAEEEQRTLMLKQQEWQLRMSAEALKSQFCDNPGQQAAIDSDFLLANQERQKNEDHSAATVVDAFIRDSAGRMEEQSLQDLRTGLNLLIHFAGDKPFNRLSKDDLIRFKNLLPSVPARIHSNKTLANMSFENAIALSQKQGHKLLAVGGELHQLAGRGPGDLRQGLGRFHQAHVRGDRQESRLLPGTVLRRAVRGDAFRTSAHRRRQHRR